MKYSRFEWLALSVGSLSAVWAVLSTWRHGPQLEECIAQALLLGVLVCAVHWGRRAGTWSALAAVVGYVAMRGPWLARMGLSADVVGLVLVRVVTYAVVGIAGGALCGRIRYVLARIDGDSNVDGATGLFREHYIVSMLWSMVGQFERYRKTFSIAVLTVAYPPEMVSSPVHRRATLRKMGSLLRSSLRLVDDIGHLEDGRFLLVLPYTEKAGARIAAERVQGAVQRLLGEGARTTVTVLGIEEDHAEISALCGPILADRPVPKRPAVAA